MSDLTPKRVAYLRAIAVQSSNDCETSIRTRREMADIVTLIDELLASRAVIARLREGLEWYAKGEHMTGDDWDEHFDSASGEPGNWLWPDNDWCIGVEDGSMAQLALDGKPWPTDPDESVGLPC